MGTETETELTDHDYLVAIGEDGRHALWPAFRPLPWGWTPEGFRGPRDDCLTHIAAVWTELRPRVAS